MNYYPNEDEDEDEAAITEDDDYRNEDYYQR